MASHRAIAVVCQAIVRLLESNYRPDDFDGAALQFDVYRSQDFKQPLESGVTVYLHRVYVNTTHRTPPSKIIENGNRRLPQLPLDLHLLVTCWGRKASLEHAILGWALRVIQDRCVFAASYLNGIGAGTFNDDESVELVPGELDVEDMMRIWDGLPHDYQTSVPYVARVVRIESLLPPPPTHVVEERNLVFQA